MSFPAPFDLTGSVGLVTGAGSGLGIEFCEALAEAGADVACADLDGDAAADTAARIEKLGRRALAITCDVTDEGQVADMVRQTVDGLGRLDVLFANAGVADPNPAPVHAFSSADWHHVLGVDLHGVFYTCREALKVMVEQGHGKIITVASMWGLAGASSVFPIPAYNTAKGAVVNLTRELGLQYATSNIQVNALCPGFYRTRLAGGAYDDPDFVSAITAFTPMGRIAEAAEIRGPALFLASAASDYMTGQTLVMDGGCLAK
jgi:NAD(P)-dependent dehydrogenase (short-subunit alcohol dehydrogenase family)